MSRTRDAALVEQARAAAAAGNTPAAIAARLGLHPSTVQRWLKAAGEARPRGRPRRDASDEEIRALRDAGMSWSQVAAATGLARSTVRDRLATRTAVLACTHLTQVPAGTVLPEVATCPHSGQEREITSLDAEE